VGWNPGFRKRPLCRSHWNFVFFSYACFGIVPQWIAKRYLCSVGPKPGVLFLAFGPGALFGDLASKRDIHWNLLLAHGLHGFFARQCLFDIRRQFLLFLLLSLDFARAELVHDLASEQL